MPHSRASLTVFPGGRRVLEPPPEFTAGSTGYKHDGIASDPGAGRRSEFPYRAIATSLCCRSEIAVPPMRTSARPPLRITPR